MQYLEQTHTNMFIQKGNKLTTKNKLTQRETIL